MCDIKLNQSTSKKPHYVSDLSKLDALLHKTHSAIIHPWNKTRQQKEQQGFPNSVKRWGWGGGRGWQISLGVFFYWIVGIWGRVNFIIWTFSRVKTTFFKYWTSIKIKITMTCVYKGNVDKIQMVKEEWLQLKIQVLLDYNMKIVIWWGETNLWYQRGK